MLFFPRRPGSNASDDSDDYQPLARGLLWDGNRLRTDPILPPPNPPTHYNPVTPFDDLGLDPDDYNDNQGSESPGDDAGSDLGIAWDQNSVTDDIPPLTEEYWFQLTDTYGVEFAINRLMDPHYSLRDRAELASQLIGLFAIVGEWAAKGLRLVRRYIAKEKLDQPLWDNPIVALICYARQPEHYVTGEALLECMFREPVERTVDHHMALAWEFHLRSEAASELVTLLRKMCSYVNQGTTYVWEEIIAPENLWDDCGGEDQLKCKIGYDCSDSSPIALWQDDLDYIERSHADLISVWGEGWEKKLDPTERWVPKGTRDFLLLLSTMATTGWHMAEIREILDRGT